MVCATDKYSLTGGRHNIALGGGNGKGSHLHSARHATAQIAMAPRSTANLLQPHLRPGSRCYPRDTITNLGFPNPAARCASSNCRYRSVSPGRRGPFHRHRNTGTAGLRLVGRSVLSLRQLVRANRNRLFRGIHAGSPLTPAQHTQPHPQESAEGRRDHYFD